MSKDIKLILKGTLYLFARVVLLCVLVFMSIPIASVAPGIFQPIFAVFYFFILLYFFILTMWHEGVRDRNRVEIGLIKENKAKGFISSGILLIFLLIVNYLPMFFDTESENIFVIIISVIKTVFSSSVSYLITLFVGYISNHGWKHGKTYDFLHGFHRSIYYLCYRSRNRLYFRL